MKANNSVGTGMNAVTISFKEFQDIDVTKTVETRITMFMAMKRSCGHILFAGSSEAKGADLARAFIQPPTR